MASPSPEPGSPPRFIVGIDLGTTNSAVAFVDTQTPDAAVCIFPVPQFVAPGEIEARETLPSFHYTPAAGEFASLRLPWHDADASHVVGVFARDHGAATPGRLVVSAKSWLCHAGVDRTANLLPWHGAPGVEKFSPMEVSARYLGHIRAAWNHRWPDYPLETQEVIVTIPASFDEIARELTVGAAQRAGLRRVVLIEEPQAAFYAWLAAHGADWTKELTPGQKILVCDVGGGTTDFTLIEVRPDAAGSVRFHRFAVGEHLILGGDNLDLALAHFVENRLTPGSRLGPRQWGVLVRRCQQAKETLLGPAAPERLTISVPAEGARLIGGALQTEITREEALHLLVDGFLPRVRLSDEPSPHRSGFQEFGLPYAPDPAITRYLAAFLSAHRTAPADGTSPTHDPARPDVVLFNGGLFESPALRERMLEVLCSWFNPDDGPAWQPLVLKNARLDLAVAQGAAYYGLVRRGLGVRISGGLARSYYIAVEQEQGPTALCLVPAGLEEGQEVRLARALELRIREPVEFPLFVSSARTNDQPGALVPLDAAQLSALPPIRTVLQSGKKSAGAEMLSVHLHARLTEIGTLELWCSEARGPRRWKLQFDVRAATQTDLGGHAGEGERAGFVDESTTQRGLALIAATFGELDLPVAPAQLVKQMEEAFGLERLEWPPSLLRKVWEELLQAEPGRRRSLLHEARWLNLLGFALRPGYGLAVDDWRVAQTWKLFTDKLAFPSNELCRAEWWILWRRIAGGLVAGQQRMLAAPLISAWKARFRTNRTSSGGGSKGAERGEFRFGTQESQEVWRLLGSLELLTPEMKVELGGLLLEQLLARGLDAWEGAGLWALGRMGARVPAYGPLNTVVPVEVVEGWVQRLLQKNEPAENLWFALMQMARRTGDRYRDLSDAVRQDVIAAMTRGQAPSHYVALARDGGDLARNEETLVFGESLPKGLRMGTTADC